MKTPIKQRIADAMNGKSRMQYHELMTKVFPQDQYPRAWNYQHNGGPPGCAMAFAQALKQMGAQWWGLGSEKIVSFPSVIKNAELLTRFKQEDL